MLIAHEKQQRTGQRLNFLACSKHLQRFNVFIFFANIYTKKSETIQCLMSWFLLLNETKELLEVEEGIRFSQVFCEI